MDELVKNYIDAKIQAVNVRANELDKKIDMLYAELKELTKTIRFFIVITTILALTAGGEFIWKIVTKWPR